MTKNRSSVIFLHETKAEIFLRKGHIGEIFMQCEHFSGGRLCCLLR